MEILWRSDLESIQPAAEVMLTRSRHPVEVFEWLMASLLVVVGVVILTSPGALAGSHMRLVASSFSAPMFGAICVAVGVLRLHILTLHPKNLLRLIGAILSAFLWGEMVYAFGYRHWSGGEVLPPGFFMLSWQFLGEIWIAARVTR